MSGRRLVLLGAALVTLIMLVSSMGLVSGLAGARPGSSDTAASAQVHASSVPSSPSPSAVQGKSPAIPAIPSNVAPSRASSSFSTDATSSTPVPYGISQVERSIAAGQVERSAALLPRSPAPGQAVRPGGPITGPSYPLLPAPMGLSDLGQGATGPYEYNTSSFAATMTLNSFQDYNPGYSAWEAAPDWMTFQLNTVTVNTSYPGADNGSFWIQNVVHFNGTELQFEDNIWNFSSPAACLEPGTLLSYLGQQEDCFYYVYGPTFQVTYPFTLTLYNNVSSFYTGSEFVPIVTFGYLMTNATATVGGYFDVVTWNGAVVNPPQFEVNGFNYNPLGYLFWDAEIILGGNGGGSNAVLQEMNATMQLLYNDSSGNYVSVPSAYDYGEDTGETSQGVAATYTGTTETLSQGPSQLYGLWNTANSIWGPAVPAATEAIGGVSGLPSWSFAFAENLTDFNAGVQNWSYWPAAPNGTISGLLPALSVGNGWCIEVFANGYDPATTCLPGSGSSVLSLTPDTSVIDTPVYLNTVAEARAFGASGVPGVQATGPNVWINDTVSTLAAPFRNLNDYDFPSFVLFASYNVSLDISVNAFTQNSSSFNYTNDFGTPLFLPAWSQGYYFNFGLGLYTVANVTTRGNQSLYYLTKGGAYPIQAVEFFGTFYATATNIVNYQDDFGVDVISSYGTTLKNISSQSGANAFLVLASGDITASDISTNGTDIMGVPSYGAIFESAFDILLDGVNATNNGLGIYAEEVTFATIQNVNASDITSAESVGIYLDDFYDATINAVSITDVTFPTWGLIGVTLDFVDLSNVNISGGSEGMVIEDGYTIGLADVSVNASFGVEVFDSLFVTVNGVEATGAGTLGVAVVESDSGTVEGVSANAGAEGLVAEEVEDLTATGITTNGTSLGAEVLDSEFVTAADISVYNESVGVAFALTLFGLAENVTIRSGSLGVLLEENEWVNVTNFNATEPALSSDYFFSPEVGLVATAAVYDVLGDNETVYNGTALNYNYGVLSNFSDYVKVEKVSEWNGVWGIGLNYTQNSTVLADFLYGNQLGLWANETANLLVVLSTIEGSSGYGIWLNGGSNAIVVENNFVANNGASIDGVYSAANVQVGVANGVTALFTAVGFDGFRVGNYWSDWNPVNGPYVINATISDTAPLSAFSEYSWLLFVESGLPTGTLWSVTLDGVTYETDVSLVIIPSWVLGDPVLSYVVTEPAGYIATPLSGTVDYTGGDQMVEIAFAPTPETVTFSETGLAPGTSWSATFDDATLSSTTSTIVFTTSAGTYSWSVRAAGYTALPASGSVTVTSSGASVSVVFTAVPMYAVTFTESGLTSGTSWFVILNGTAESSTSTTVVFEEIAGTYSYAIGSVTGYGVTTPSTGSVTVTTAAVNVGVTYTPIPPTAYTVTFTESGLTTGTIWSVTLNAVTEFSDTATVEFSETPGTYTYTVGAVTGYSTPAGGSVTVTDASQEVSVTYTAVPPPATYTLTFTESGLTSSTGWSVTVNGVTYPSTTSSIVVSGLNGTYTYTVSAVSGYTVSPASGTVTVTSDQSVTVTFTPVTTPTTYTIMFTETGLPSGTSWSVTVNGATYTESTATITVTGVAGAYTYSVGAVAGYAATPGSGTVTLTSSGASQTIAFSPVVTPSSSSGLSSTDWAIIGIVIGLVVGALIGALLARRGRSGPAGESSEPVQSWQEGQGEAQPSEEQPAEEPAAHPEEQEST